MKNLKFSILIPTYKGASVISETLRSILSQSFTNYEIIVQEDASGDNIQEVIDLYKDKRIKLFKNDHNVGYSVNLEKARKNAKGDIIYLMGQDDVLGTDALLNTYKAFLLSEDIGAVTRPYFWFDKDINIPVRAKIALNPNEDEIVTMDDSYDKIIEVFKSLDQLSGLAYRAKYMEIGFHKDIFPCHVYPFAWIMKTHPVVYLKDYNIAVRIATSQTRSISSIYNNSPVLSWVHFFRYVFFEQKYEKFRKYCIQNYICVAGCVGLVQIKNYAKTKYLYREIYYLLKYRIINIISPAFWFFSLVCIFVPSNVLIPLVDWYKNSVNSMRLRNIKFTYKI